MQQWGVRVCEKFDMYLSDTVYSIKSPEGKMLVQSQVRREKVVLVQFETLYGKIGPKSSPMSM